MNTDQFCNTSTLEKNMYFFPKEILAKKNPIRLVTYFTTEASNKVLVSALFISVEKRDTEV
jgi:hypothetical protein